MTLHVVEMVTPLHARCTCCTFEWNASRTGSWLEWERAVNKHLRQFRNCDRHGQGVERTREDRCALCERERQADIRRRKREAKAQPPARAAARPGPSTGCCSWQPQRAEVADRDRRIQVLEAQVAELRGMLASPPKPYTWVGVDRRTP